MSIPPNIGCAVAPRSARIGWRTGLQESETATPVPAPEALCDGLPDYAQTHLMIRTKTGQIEPLRLNRAQNLLHAALEDQRGQTGKVRALVLKARQQGFSAYSYADPLRLAPNEELWAGQATALAGGVAWDGDAEDL